MDERDAARYWVRVLEEVGREVFERLDEGSRDDGADTNACRDMVEWIGRAFGFEVLGADADGGEP